MSYRYDRVGERVDQDDERSDEQATRDHIEDVRRILRGGRPATEDVHQLTPRPQQPGATS